MAPNNALRARCTAATIHPKLFELPVAIDQTKNTEIRTVVAHRIWIRPVCDPIPKELRYAEETPSSFPFIPRG
jgi:hypothetical protein